MTEVMPRALVAFSLRLPKVLPLAAGTLANLTEVMPRPLVAFSLRLLKVLPLAAGTLANIAIAAGLCALVIAPSIAPKALSPEEPQVWPARVDAKPEAPANKRMETRSPPLMQRPAIAGQIPQARATVSSPLIIAVKTPSDKRMETRSAPAIQRPAIPAQIPQAGAAGSSALTFAIGDRLKITFFERLVPVDHLSKMGKDRLSGLVERVDLTGLYTVEVNGSVFLPFLGPIEVVGQTPQQVEDILAAVFKKETGGDGEVSIVITEREPIYVVGPVPSPGTYKYTPGATVLHALALSGGLEGGAWEFSQIMETLRESEKLQRSAERLKKLLARRAVLQAEREGKQPVAPTRLIELAGEKQAKALIQDALTMRRFVLASKQVLKSAAEADIRGAREELAKLRKKAAYVESNLASKSQIVTTLDSLRRRGSGRIHELYQAQSAKADVEERWQEVMVTMTRAEQKLSQAKHEKLKLASDQRVQTEQELRSIEGDITEEQVSLTSSGKLLQTAGKVWPRLLAARQGVSFEIVRRSSEGLKEFPAVETTPLQPGDLLRIKIRTSSEIEAMALR